MDVRISIFWLSQALILAICDKLSLDDLKQLRLTCRKLGQIVAFVTLKKLSISTDGKGLTQEIVQTLRRSTQPESLVVDLTRELTLEKLWSSPSADPHIQEGLLQVLASFKSVTTLTWNAGYREPPWLQETIWAGIQKLPRLNLLRIHATFLRVRVNLETLTALKSLAIRGITKTQADYLFLSIMKLYASSSNLTFLWLQNASAPLSRSRSLHQLFGGYPQKEPQLRQLILNEFPVCLDQITLPHLRHLTKLTLTLVPAHTSTDFQQAGQDIWEAMVGSGIRLEEVQTNAVTVSFSIYLSTFTGLKTLELGGEWPFNNQTASDEAATAFFNLALPNHIESLEQLRVEARFEDHWCFDHDNCFVVAKCTKLRHLYMKFRSEQIGATALQLDQPGAFGAQACIVENFIDMIVVHMPYLQHVAVSGTVHSAFRHYSFVEMHHVYRTLDAIADQIGNYKAPLFCQYLPPLSVLPVFRYSKGFHRFRGVRNAKDGRLIYTTAWHDPQTLCASSDAASDGCSDADAEGSDDPDL